MKKIQIPPSEKSVEAPDWLATEFLMGNIEDGPDGSYIIRGNSGTTAATTGDWISIQHGELVVTKDEPM